MSVSQKTVLQYVQAALSVMDSDEVDSVSDTTEATQVAELFYDVYYELVNRQEWSFLRGALQLTASGDTSTPTKVIIPEDAKRVRLVTYNIDTAGGYQRRELVYLDPETFMRRFSGGQAAGNRLLVTPAPGLQFYVNVDRMPSFWTAFDDEFIWLDSYDTSIESTIQTAKLGCFGDRIPTLVIEDAYTPELPVHMIPLLQHTLNQAAMQTFKQTESKMDEIRVRRQTGQARRAESRITRKTYYWNQFGRRNAGMNLGSGRRWWDNNNTGGPGAE